MTKNPHQKTIIDEASGVKVDNPRYVDWETGYAACIEREAKRLLRRVNEEREKEVDNDTKGSL